MMSHDLMTGEKFRLLLDRGVLSEEGLSAAESSSAARGASLERILISEHGVPRHAMLESLSAHYGCPCVEYDERIPIPPELLSDLVGERTFSGRWFPIIRDGGTVVIAASDPSDPEMMDEVKGIIQAERYDFLVSLEEDIRWFIQDFLHARPGLLIGTERTGLAFWRNTMAHWRTRLACYRTDLADARTDLAFLRWGLGFIALSDALMRTHGPGPVSYLPWMMIAAGFSLALWGLRGYLRIRRSRMKPPGNQTLVEVTSATLQFLEDYHFIEGAGAMPPMKQTMLSRLGDFLADHCTILYPSPASKERTHLARERNVLAGQRTVAACYRTIYSRARTGLAFIRTGVSFSGLGLGLMHYFGLSLLTILDSVLIIAGTGMIADGFLWYMPVRKEQAETPRCPAPES